MHILLRFAAALAATTLATTAFADTHASADADPSSGTALDISAPFLAFVHPIDPLTAQSMIDVSWHPGCPVAIADLRAIDMTYWGFDNRPHWGRLIVNNDISAAAVRAFRSMYVAHFPIRRMEPVDKYGGSDDDSMAADNSSAFNCRAITGGSSYSVHSYGRAIDINTIENPYVKGTLVLPPAGIPYADRANVRPGMIVEGDLVTRAFDAEGFDWGGRWTTLKDFQHFEIVPPTP